MIEIYTGVLPTLQHSPMHLHRKLRKCTLHVGASH